MARIALASYLKTLHGVLGDVVFYSRYGREYARPYVTPANPDTGAQRAIRGTFGDAVRAWQGLPREEKVRWNRQARWLPMSGYNLFISRYMKENIPAALESAALRGDHGAHLHFSLNASVSVSAPFQPANGCCTPVSCVADGPPAG
ncbi:MAG: hypothetical protein JXA20_14155 [Spirochaetes bacterium]|nr:hypothetical protein [Spirochaetota bacterium]